MPLIGNVLKPLSKSDLMLLWLTAAASGVTTLIILNEEMNNIMEIFKSLEESGLFIKGVSEKIKN